MDWMSGLELKIMFIAKGVSKDATRALESRRHTHETRSFLFVS